MNISFIMLLITLAESIIAQWHFVMQSIFTTFQGFKGFFQMQSRSIWQHLKSENQRAVINAEVIMLKIAAVSLNSQVIGQ